MGWNWGFFFWGQWWIKRIKTEPFKKLVYIEPRLNHLKNKQKIFTTHHAPSFFITIFNITPLGFSSPKKIITLRRQSRQNAEIIQLNPCMTVDEKNPPPRQLLQLRLHWQKNKVLRHSPTTLHVESFSFSLFFVDVKKRSVFEARSSRCFLSRDYSVAILLHTRTYGESERETWEGSRALVTVLDEGLKFSSYACESWVKLSWNEIGRKLKMEGWMWGWILKCQNLNISKMAEIELKVYIEASILRILI
jgi:hypothetical protein